MLLGIDARPYTFSYAELKAATEDFSPANKLGEGGFGPVYQVCRTSKLHIVLTKFLLEKVWLSGLLDHHYTMISCNMIMKGWNTCDTFSIISLLSPV